MPISHIIRYFFIWKVTLLVILLFSISIFSLQFNFLGGGLQSYLHAPYLWSHLNFDGEHYATIAQNGYKPLEYFFFPMYPILIYYFSFLFEDSQPPQMLSASHYYYRTDELAGLQWSEMVRGLFIVLTVLVVLITSIVLGARRLNDRIRLRKRRGFTVEVQP